MTGYLDLVGYRLLDGFDISGPCALELPDVLLRAIRVAVAQGDVEESDVEERIAEVRSKVPEEHRAEFDELLGRGAADLPDPRRARRVQRHLGLRAHAPRPCSAGGRRLAASGRIDEAEHLIDAGLDEMRALLSGADGPSADELAARAAYRASHSAKEAPAVLGDPPSSSAGPVRACRRPPRA